MPSLGSRPATDCEILQQEINFDDDYFDGDDDDDDHNDDVGVKYCQRHNRLWVFDICQILILQNSLNDINSDIDIFQIC